MARDLLPGLRQLEVKLVESSPNLDLTAPYVHVTWWDIMSEQHVWGFVTVLFCHLVGYDITHNVITTRMGHCHSIVMSLVTWWGMIANPSQFMRHVI